MKLFVYGTLQKGHWNNSLLRGATFFSKGVTVKPYVLFQCGFPKAVPSLPDPAPDGVRLLPVMGELWDVEDHHIQRCDRLEGHPDWYIRREIQVRVEYGREISAFIYEMPEWQNAPLCTIIDDEYYQWGHN